MEDFNTFDDVQTDVVDQLDTEALDTSEVTEEVTTETVVEPAKPQQSAEENARYAAARRQAEAEKAAIKAQNDRLMAALSQYGYTGSPEEIADMLTAQTQNITVEEAREQRETEEKYLSEIQQKDSELEFYREKAKAAMMADDLNTLKANFKEDKTIQSLKNITELGNEFFSLLSATHDPVLAYDALNAKKARETKPVPQDIGAVNSASNKDKDFYTPDEVDRLTDKDFDNPKIMERVRQSMLKWK